MRLTDSHCHLTDEAFGEDREAAVERARAAGVTRIVAVGSDAADSRAALDMANRHDGVWCTAGVHPHRAASGNGDDLGAIRATAENPLCVAVGETGLDYYYDNAPRRSQRQSFERHAALAAELGLPLVVHSRDAAEDTAALIRECGGQPAGVVHCFAGPGALLEAALQAGWLVSFTGVVTFRGFDPGIVQAVPAGRYMIETDAPYLAPVPRRGKRNEPGFVVHVAEAVARIRGESAEQVANDSWDAAARFFGLAAASA